MDPLMEFVEFFERKTKKTITHTQLQIAKAIFNTNEGVRMFDGQGRQGGKTTLLTALEAFAHQQERVLGGSSAPTESNLIPEPPPKE